MTVWALSVRRAFKAINNLGFSTSSQSGWSYDDYARKELYRIYGLSAGFLLAYSYGSRYCTDILLPPRGILPCYWGLHALDIICVRIINQTPSFQSWRTYEWEHHPRWLTCHYDMIRDDTDRAHLCHINSRIFPFNFHCLAACITLIIIVNLAEI